MHVFPYEVLKEFTTNVFLQMNCSMSDALKATDVLLTADLRGVDSHGIARLCGYVRLWENGRINSEPDIRIVHETPSTALIDGDSGLGLVVAPEAMSLRNKKGRAGRYWLGGSQEFQPLWKLPVIMPCRLWNTT